MTQPPYGQGANRYQNPQESVGGMTPPPSSGYGPPPSGYGPPAQGGYGAPQAAGYPGLNAPYSAAQAPKSKTGLIIAAVIGVVAIAGIILAVVLVNKVPSPTAAVQGDDQALNQLSQSCFEGDMSARDQLFTQSPLGSEYETYGNTCGGRVAEADVQQRFCTDIF